MHKTKKLLYHNYIRIKGQVLNHFFVSHSLALSILTNMFMIEWPFSGPCPNPSTTEWLVSDFHWAFCALHTWSRLNCLRDQLRFVHHSHNHSKCAHCYRLLFSAGGMLAGPFSFCLFFFSFNPKMALFALSLSHFFLKRLQECEGYQWKRPHQTGWRHIEVLSMIFNSSGNFSESWFSPLVHFNSISIIIIELCEK